MPQGVLALPRAPQSTALPPVLAIRDAALLTVDEFPGLTNGRDQKTDSPVVKIHLTERDARQVRRIARANLGRRIALVADGQVLAILAARYPVVDGWMDIEGGFTDRAALLLTLHFEQANLLGAMRIVTLQTADFPKSGR